MGHDKKRWEQRYNEDNVPWDLGKPYKQLVDYVNENCPSRALDVGCGTGTDAIYLAQNGFNVSAIDISGEAVRIAETKAQKAKVSIDFRVSNVLDMPFEDGTFEFTHDNGCFHSFEGSSSEESDWRTYVKEMHRVMKPKARYLMKCFSEEPSNPHRLSQETIRQYFSGNFNILYMRPVMIEGKHGNHEGYSCLMERK